MRLSTRILLAANRAFPRPRFPVRATASDYANWEYHETAVQLALLESGGLTLDVDRVLDLGCGLGGKTVYLAERARGRTLGLDLEGGNVSAARGFARSRSVDVDFAVSDASRLPVRDASVDTIVTTDTFEHFSDPAAALSEVARVLRRGGQAGIVFGPWGSPLGSHLYDRLYLPWCHMLFSTEALAEALRESARRTSRGLGEERARAEQEAAERQVRYFREDLNRMTLRRFEHILQSERRLHVRSYHKQTNRSLQVLSPLLALPGPDEYLTGLLAVVLTRL